MSETKAKREPYLDVAKCLAIFLIVVRHVRDYAGDPSVYAGMPGVDNVSVHLPVVAFFAISGYLSRGFLERVDVHRLVRRLVVYLWPLLTVVLGLGSLVCLATFGRIIVPQNGWLRHVFTVGWFFFCLLTCEVVTFAAFAFARGRKAPLLLSLGAAYGVIWLVPVGLFHALEMIPFFWFGLFVLPRIVRMRFTRVLGLSMLAIYLLLAFSLGDFAGRGLAYHETTMHLLDFSWHGFALLLARYAIGLAAVCGGILSVKALVERFPALARLSGMGSQTLGVFYMHMIVLNVYFATVAWTGGGWAGRFALSLVLFLVSYALVAASHVNAILSAALWNPLGLLRKRSGRVFVPASGHPACPHPERTGSRRTCSFVIPVYRTEQYLPRCLDSLVAQTDGDFEAVIVDDGSPEEKGRGASAEEIVARYDSRFRYVRQDRNRSTFQAKATGATVATGDYIVPLDSDDYVLPGLVSEIKNELGGEKRWRWTKDDSNSSVNLNLQPQPSSPDVVVYQMAKEYRGKTYPVKYNHPRCRCSGDEALEKLFAGRIFMPVCGKVIRREVFLKAYEGLGVGPDFYLNFTDDLCWLLPILFNTKTVAFIPYKGYRYWRHDDSMTKDVMAPERIHSLAEQSRKSVDAVIAYAKRLGRDERTIAQIRAQLYPTIRWLMRDMGQSREALENAYGSDLVAETISWDESSGGAVVKLGRHLVKYGIGATVREIAGRLRGVEV